MLTLFPLHINHCYYSGAGPGRDVSKKIDAVGRLTSQYLCCNINSVDTRF